jgi:hypothetical protein
MSVLVLGHGGDYFEKQVEEICERIRARYVCIENENRLYKYMSENEIESGSVMFVVLSSKDDASKKSLFIKKIRTIRRDIHITVCIDSMDLIEVAFDFKPDGMIQYYISQVALAKYMGKLIKTDEYVSPDNNFISLKRKSAIFKIDVDEIVYAESDGRQINVYFKNHTSLTFYMKLNDLQKMLPDKFIRVHQSYLVNLDEIEHVENGYLILKEGRIIKISKKYIDWVRQMIS